MHSVSHYTLMTSHSQTNQPGPESEACHMSPLPTASHRLVGVFEDLSGLLVAAQLLHALPLQVPLQDLLHQEVVGPFGPQEDAVSRRSPPQR